MSKLGSSMTKGFSGMTKSVDKFKNRVTRLVGAVFVFNVLRRGLTKLYNGFMDCLKSNDQFSTSLAQVKGNLMTAFAPIYEAIMPAINTLMGALVSLTNVFANFIATIFGKTARTS